MPTDFIWLRPLWLLALPMLAWAVWRLSRHHGLAGAWTRFVASELQPHVLSGHSDRRYRFYVWLPALTGLLAILALAGPAWERQPQSLFRSDSGLVIVLDLSRSMDVKDVEPTRLQQALLKIREVLRRRPADQLGLVVYTTEAYTVTPLTTDARNIELQLSALTTDIMPTQGSMTSAGLRKGGELLERAALRSGDLLLITDDVDESAGATARQLAARGYRTSVLAVGTAQGAPITMADGKLLVDDNGAVVVPRVDEAALRRLAMLGQGQFAALKADHRDLDYVLTAGVGRDGQGVRRGQPRSEMWMDRGPWLVIMLLPFALLMFRRGWVVALTIAFLLPIPAAYAANVDWRDFLRRRDQQALAALQRNDPERAAELFTDLQWRAVAHYRAGRYKESAAEFERLDTPEAHYNGGNALARAGQLEAALEAYEQTLDYVPYHADALHNHKLVSMLIDQMPPSEPGGSAPSESGEDERRGSGESDAERNESQPGPRGLEPQEAKRAPASKAPRSSGEKIDGQPQMSDMDVNFSAAETKEAMERRLQAVKDDPGELLRRKFELQYRLRAHDSQARTAVDAAKAKPW